MSQAALRSVSPNSTQDQVNQQSWHKYLYIPLFLLFPWSVYSSYQLYVDVSIRQKLVAAAQTSTSLQSETGILSGGKMTEYPQWSDLSITFYFLLVLVASRLFFCKYVFLPLGDWLLPSLEEKKGRWSKEARDDRVQRFSVVCFKFIYFVCFSAYGAMVLLDKPWVPTQLGGIGDSTNLWVDHPFTYIDPDVKQYYLLSLSYHAHSLVFHVFTIHRNDFIEMTLHHTCAILLVVYSYFANYIRVGVLVLFLHDLADVWAYAVKVVVDTRHTAVTLGVYFGLLSVWGYTRLYVFPFYVIPSSFCFDCAPEFIQKSYYYCVEFMLVVLQFLHVYWYVLFLVMGYNFLKTGKTVDIQQKAGATDKHEYEFADNKKKK